MRVLTFFSVVSIAVSCSNVGHAQDPTDCPSVEQLAGKYPHGSIYLTYIPLNDMTQLLNDEEKFEALSSKPPGKEVLTVYRAFLNRHRETTMSQALAFLQLNLITSQSGFKKVSDNDGTIREEAWSAEEVEGIACFCDRFIQEMLDFENVFAHIRRQDLSLGDTWKTLRTAQRNPYIPSLRVTSLAQEVAKQIGERSDELDAIQKLKPKLFQSLEQFKKESDATLLELNREVLRDRGLNALIERPEIVRDLLERAAEYEERRGAATNRLLWESLEERQDDPGQKLKQGIKVPPLRLLVEPSSP